MSFQSIVTQRLTALTNAFNALATNSRKIDEMPVQAVLDNSSKIHVSRAGISESLEVSKIVDAFSPPPSITKTSDITNDGATGVSTYVELTDLPDPTSYQNGLTDHGGLVELGGALEHETTINQNGNTLVFDSGVEDKSNIKIGLKSTSPKLPANGGVLSVDTAGEVIYTNIPNSSNITRNQAGNLYYGTNCISSDLYGDFKTVAFGDNVANIAYYVKGSALVGGIVAPAANTVIFSVALGNFTFFDTINPYNDIAIGFGADVPSNTGNQIRLGNTSITYFGCQVPLTVTSDTRWKYAVENSDLGLEFLNTLNPVKFKRFDVADDMNFEEVDEKATPEEKEKHQATMLERYKNRKISYNKNKDANFEYGFIAQEFGKTLKKHTKNAGMHNKQEDSFETIRYNDLIAVLVKAVQELTQEVNILKSKIK